MSIIITEIFYSIQGESTHWGRPCVFIRLTGCNLRCAYCDTVYAYEQGSSMEVADILKKVAGFNCNLVEITGGEPLIQDQTPELINRLLQDRYEVMLETNGSMDIRIIDPACIRIVDMKCPSSNENKNNNYNNLNYLNNIDQVKFVLQTREDYEFAKQILPKIKNRIPAHHVLFSPVTHALHPQVLAKWMLDDQLTARLQLQLHKLIWPDRDRGV